MFQPLHKRKVDTVLDQIHTYEYLNKLQLLTGSAVWPTLSIYSNASLLSHAVL